MSETSRPDLRSAWVPLEKITDYLLDPESVDGAPKAQFFLAHGYSRETTAALAEALSRALPDGDLVASHSTPFGQKWEIDVRLATPRGTTIHLASVWIQETGTDRLRLVTAYPSPRRRRP